jgi:hypothetical protein
MNGPMLDRRGFLAALGVGAGSLALPSLSRARAADGPPTRFLLFYTSQGCAPHRWACDPHGVGDSRDWDDDWTTWALEDFSDSLAPLHPWADQVTAIGGLGLVSAEADGASYRHERMQVHGITGANASWINGFPYGGAASIDQRIADHLSRADRYRSIELSVAGGLSYDGFGSAVVRGPAQPLPVIDDPRELWDRLFGWAGDADPVLARQGSVLDAVAGRYAALAPRLSAEDQRKLSVHRDLVRDLERRIVGVQTATCDISSGRPTAYGDPDHDFEAQLGLLAAAMSCDLTRVGSIQMGQLTMAQLGLGSGDVHAEIAHDIYRSEYAAAGMAEYMAVHARQFTRILEVLDSIPEGGGSLLDHTVVAWLPELADSWHGMDRFPVVVGGGGATRLRTGRYLNYARTTPFETPGPDGTRPTMGVPHQKALIGICQAAGLDIDRLGVESVRGTNGSTIDCTGPLPEMLT